MIAVGTVSCAQMVHSMVWGLYLANSVIKSFAVTVQNSLKIYLKQYDELT